MTKTVNAVHAALVLLFAATALSMIASVKLKAEEYPQTMSCKKLYYMQDVVDGEKFKKELNSKCSKSVLTELDKLATAYAKEKDATVRAEIVKRIMKLEDKLEVE